MDQVWWLLKKLGRTGKRNLQYYIANPREALDELIEYAKENPWKFAFACLGIGLGIACIVVPLAIGFGPAGPILGSIAAGWQSSIGSVAAGSAFALLQSMAMTGAFTAIGGTLIGIGSAIPLVSSLFGRLRSWVGGLFGSGGSGGGGPGPGSPFGCLVSSLDPSWMDKLLLQTAGSDAVLLKRHMQPRRGWFLESKHSKVDFAGSRDREEGAHCERRILITNSQQTWDMVWDHMDAWNDGKVKEYALKGFAVEIRLLRPKKNRRDEEFCEMFIDHEAGCPPDCFCLGDYDNLEEESL